MAQQNQQFTAFAGVFRPVLLTVLGAMLYLREGWLVGNAGLLGAIAVILGAYIITGSTALSVASIATNVRVQAGGAFAIIAQALGLEAGGAIGIGLYVAQAASCAMYLYAFSEGWGYLFDSHPSGVVACIAFIAVSALAYRSAQLALAAQGIMLGVVVIAMGSMFGGVFSADLHSPQWIGSIPDGSLLETFALFFPAATGIMVGTSMSGRLIDPRRAIPKGTLWAWGVTLGVYLLGAVWYSMVATPEELLNNKVIVVEKALVGWIVLVGIVCSTLMAALSSLVAAPQLLVAMAEHKVVPMSGWLSQRSETGEPRNATLFTIGIAAVGLLSGSLDAIAPIITSCFVITYLAVNLVVLLEQRLGMISFRPTFAISPTMPLIGVFSTSIALVLTSPRGGLLEFAAVLGIYVVLLTRKLDTPWETVRSGIAVAIGAWAARLAMNLDRSKRAWKPDLLVPIQGTDELDRLQPLLMAAGAHNGSAKLVAIGDKQPNLLQAITALGTRLRTAGVYATWTQLHTEQGFEPAVRLAMDSMRGAFFPPNLLVVDVEGRSEAELQALNLYCREHRVGMMLFFSDPEGPLQRGGDVNVWITDRSPDWKMQFDLANLDLQCLLGYLLTTRLGRRLRLVTVLSERQDGDGAREFVRQLRDMARLPKDTTAAVLTGTFMGKLKSAPAAGIHIFGMPPEIALDRLKEIHLATGGAALFLLDSGDESVLA